MFGAAESSTGAFPHGHSHNPQSNGRFHPMQVRINTSLAPFPTACQAVPLHPVLSLCLWRSRLARSGLPMLLTASLRFLSGLTNPRGAAVRRQRKSCTIVRQFGVGSQPAELPVGPRDREAELGTEIPVFVRAAATCGSTLRANEFQIRLDSRRVSVTHQAAASKS